MNCQFCLTLALGLLCGCAEAPDIFEAAKLGDGQRVSECLSAGAKVDQPDTTGATALHWAALGGHDHIIRQLLNAKADVNAAEAGSGMTPLHGAARWNRLTSARLLLANGAKVDVRDRFGRTPLFDVMVKDRFEMIGMVQDLDVVRIQETSMWMECCVQQRFAIMWQASSARPAIRSCPWKCPVWQLRR